MIGLRESAGGEFPTGGAAKWLATLGIVASFCISPMALTAVGVNYDTPGGNPLLKLHPANWLFAMALSSNLLAQRDPVGWLSDLPRAFPGAMLFATMAAFTVLFATLVQHAPMMPLVDTFFAATAMLVLHEGVDETTLTRWRWLVDAILFANACVGIIEFLTQTRLTPFIVAGEPVWHDYRSTALFGHPLVNAGTTAGYVLMLFLGGHPKGRLYPKAALMSVQLVALVAFGGRTAIVLSGLLLAAGSLPTLAEVVNGRRFDQLAGIVFVIAAPAILAAIVAAAWGGLFSDLVERFEYDRGSAQARVVLFSLFDNFSLEDLLLGPNPERLASLQSTLGIQYGIENSWLGLVFQYGAIATVFFVLGLLALLGEFARRTRPKSVFIVLYFLILVSSSASLSVKSFGFNQFAILLLIVFGRRCQSSLSLWRSSPRRALSAVAAPRA